MQTIPVAKQPTMAWRADLNGGYWICNADIALREWELERIRQYMLVQQARNRKGLPPGDIRDDLDASVKALHAKRVATNVTGEDPFRATRAVGERIITLGV